jgi:metallophosphoesterase (TIGR03767 family)
VTLTRTDFVRLHLESPPRPGPPGHGFSEANLAGPTLYYTFDIADDIVGIMLDTTNPFGGADGSLDAVQMLWLQQELIAVHSRYYGPLGNVITTANPNKLVVLFSHHNSQTMGNLQGFSPTAPRFTADQLLQMLHLFPNVILWVNGHTHYNRVIAQQDRLQRTGGLWEVNTASLIDFPQQARTIEIVDNRDGTLSIFAILVDHAGAVAPARTPPYDLLDIAGISRELAANDFLIAEVPLRIGDPVDRNVELLIGKPF